MRCLKGNDTRLIASIKHEKQVFLFCGPQEVMQWPTPQAATKFFKRFYDIIFRTGGKGIKEFHLLADFRLHSVSTQALTDDSFERSIVKPEIDKEKVLRPEDYSIIPIQLHGVTMQVLPCHGNQAEEWHKRGTRPPFPKFR